MENNKTNYGVAFIQSRFTNKEEKQKFYGNVIAFQNTNKNIRRCSQESLWNCLYQLYIHNISLFNKEAYIVPYGNEAQIQFSYYYYINVLRYSNLTYWKKEINGDTYTIHYAITKLEKEYKYSISMNKKEIEKWNVLYSKSFRHSSAWKDQYDIMAFKLIIKKVARDLMRNPLFLPDKPETINNAINLDQATYTNEGIKYLDNPQNDNINKNTQNLINNHQQKIDEIKEINGSESS